MRTSIPLLVLWLCAATALAQPAPEARSGRDPQPPGESSTSAPAEAFAFHPVVDGAILGGSIGFGVSLELILQTSELMPDPPGDPDQLIVIDRWRAKSDDFWGGEVSNIGSYVVFGYAVADSLLMDVLDRGDPWYHYALLYAEAATITLVFTDLSKIAVRRPRPTAYNTARDGDMASDTTNTSLSFFSGHASLTAAIATTAIYLAFTRTDDPVERWLVFSGGVIATLLISASRVTQGDHFPSDVIAGASVGASVGLLVPYMHRRDTHSGGATSLRPWSDASGGSGLVFSTTF